MACLVIIECSRNGTELDNVRENDFDTVSGTDCKPSKVRDAERNIESRIAFRNDGECPEVTGTVRKLHLDFSLVNLYFLGNRIDDRVEVCKCKICNNTGLEHNIFSISLRKKGSVDCSAYIHISRN